MESLQKSRYTNNRQKPYKQNKRANRERQEKTDEAREKEREPLARPVILSKQLLLEAGVHFGHKTGDWNPRCFKYLYGIHNNIHVINLSKTLSMWPEVRQRIIDTVSNGMEVLFVGTKRQASSCIREEALNCGQPYVDKKWKGGTLTNLKTMRKRVERMNWIEEVLSNPDISARYVKKELLLLKKEYDKLDESIGGIRKMECYPGLVFVVDINKEKTAVEEARKLGIPVIALLDSNCDPDKVDYPIPSNDDAYKSIRLFASAVSDAVKEAKELSEQVLEMEN